VARTCTICSHPQRDATRQALVAGVSLPALAARYSTIDSTITIGRMALQRHATSHLPATLAQASAAAEVAHADDQLAQVRALQTRTLAILSKAEEAQDLRTALQGVAQARGNLELLAKLAGQLAQEGTVNLVVSPEWVMVRAALRGALTPYPEARLAVAGRLVALESAVASG